ncbi:MAG: hypothetical protein WB384_09950, partial [Candidatus Sulfotelmatobacter sp.]
MSGQRAENEVVGELATPAEMALTFRQHPVHVRKVERQVTQNLIRRDTFGHGVLRRLATRRHVSESHNDAHGKALRQGWTAGAGQACVKAFLQVGDSGPVSTIQVLKDLGRGPLPFRVARQLGGIHAAGSLGDGVLHPLQVGVHGMLPSAHTTGAFLEK